MQANGIKIGRQAQALSGPYVSASRLNTWLRCPLSYRLRYVDGIPTPSTPSLFLGKMVHRGLEIYYSYRELGVTLFPEFVRDRMQKLWGPAVEEELISFKSKDEEQELQEKALKLVSAYIEQTPMDEPKPLAVEKRFAAPLIDPLTGEDLGLPLVGIIDLVLDDEAGPLIADFKTAARSSSRVEVMHELQLSCYSYLFRAVSGRTEAGIEIRSLIKTKVPKFETERFGPREERHFERLFSVIGAYLDAVNSNQFHIRPGLGCSFCDYREQVCEN